MITSHLTCFMFKRKKQRKNLGKTCYITKLFRHSKISDAKGGSPSPNVSRAPDNSLANVCFQSPFEANEMFCLLKKYVHFTNKKQLLKCFQQNSYLGL